MVSNSPGGEIALSRLSLPRLRWTSVTRDEFFFFSWFPCPIPRYAQVSRMEQRGGPGRPIGSVAYFSSLRSRGKRCLTSPALWDDAGKVCGCSGVVYGCVWRWRRGLPLHPPPRPPAPCGLSASDPTIFPLPPLVCLLEALGDGPAETRNDVFMDEIIGCRHCACGWMQR